MLPVLDPGEGGRTGVRHRDRVAAAAVYEVGDERVYIDGRRAPVARWQLDAVAALGVGRRAALVPLRLRLLRELNGNVRGRRPVRILDRPADRGPARSRRGRR